MNIKIKLEEIKNLLLESEEDLFKNASGNKAAGVRSRKKIKQLNELLKELKKLTLEVSKND